MLRSPHSQVQITIGVVLITSTLFPWLTRKLSLQIIGVSSTHPLPFSSHSEGVGITEPVHLSSD